MATLTAGGVALPEPVSLSVEDEIIWSSNTGRSSETGKMLGDVVAQKKNLEIKWGVLTEAEMKLIADNMVAGFYTLKFRDNGSMTTITVYRGSLSKEHLGYIGDGTYYYKSATVSVVQQ